MLANVDNQFKLIAQPLMRKKSIRGGFSFTKGGVAVVRISVSTKYQNSDKLKISCSP